MVKNHAGNTFDVAISFCRKERTLARAVARRLRAAGLLVYFDEWNAGETSGRLLEEELASIYFKRSRHCIVLLSQAYISGRWSALEWTAIEQRWKESGPVFLTVVPIDLARMRDDGTTAFHPSVSHAGATRIAEVILKKLGSDRGFIWLKRTRFLCGLQTALLALVGAGTFFVSPHFWLVHLVYWGLVGVFVAMSACFFYSPLFITSTFLLFSAYLTMTAAVEHVLLAELALGIPTIALLIAGVSSVRWIGASSRRQVLFCRQHPFASIVSCPHIVIVGDGADSRVRKLCGQFAARGMRFTLVPIPSDTSQPIDWPDSTKFTLLIANSVTLTETLWNHKARLTEFEQWRKQRTCTLVPVTLDGTLISHMDSNVGYLDTRQIGAFRSVLFLQSAFTNRVSESDYEQLRAVLAVSAVAAGITALYKLILHAMGTSMNSLTSDNAALWTMVAAGCIALWKVFYRRPWIAYGSILALSCCLAYGVMGILMMTQNVQAVIVAVVVLPLPVFALVNWMKVLRGEISFRSAYRIAQHNSTHCASVGESIGRDNAVTEPVSQDEALHVIRDTGDHTSPVESGRACLHLKGRDGRIVQIPEGTVATPAVIPEPSGCLAGFVFVFCALMMYTMFRWTEINMERLGCKWGDPGYWGKRWDVLTSDVGMILAILTFAPFLAMIVWMALAEKSQSRNALN